MNDQKTTTWPRYTVYSLIVIVVLLLILILILYLVKSPLIYRSSAYSSTSTSSSTGGPQPGGSSNLSLDNSYIFASPLRAKVGGEKIRITVFILSDRGLGISGKTVIVGGGKNLLHVTSIQPVTDGQGRATFDVSSETSPGVYIIQASVDGVNLVQQATISFD
jgi:hypothetical protein